VNRIFTAEGGGGEDGVMDERTFLVAQADAKPAKQSAAVRWRKLLEDQRASGLPVSAFCRERGIPASSLFAWRRKLTRGGGGAAPLAGGETFKPVTIAAAAGARRHAGHGGAGDAIELRLRGRRRLVVRRGFDRQLLAELVSALESMR
jgi:transposase-like protein